MMDAIAVMTNIVVDGSTTMPLDRHASQVCDVVRVVKCKVHNVQCSVQCAVAVAMASGSDNLGIGQNVIAA